MSNIADLFSRLSEEDKQFFIAEMGVKAKKNTEFNLSTEEKLELIKTDSTEYNKLIDHIHKIYKKVKRLKEADILLKQIQNEINKPHGHTNLGSLILRWNRGEGYECVNCGGVTSINHSGEIDDHIEEYEEWGCSFSRFRCKKVKI